MKLQGLRSITDPFATTERMPLLFLGHGTPMSTIEENEFVAGFRKVSKEFQRPNAVLCVSAHWETLGTHATAMAMPRTTHDFGGFPKALFEMQYPAPGDPGLAAWTKTMIRTADVVLDRQWGLITRSR